jgi:phage terminase large subunit
MTSPAEFPEKLAFLFQPARYKVAYGGRGGAKSWGFARALLILGAQDKLRILCDRELQNSIQDSVHKLLADQVDALGLTHLYEVQQATIRGLNGTEFIFSGLRSNITKVKSMEAVDIVWVEEAQTVSDASWATLIPTIRKEGSEIWVSFNPDQDTDPTYRRFITDSPPDAHVVQIGWQDNPWLPSTLRSEKDYLYRTDPEAAAHVWGGGTRRVSLAQVLRGRYVVESFEPQADWNGPYYGCDWGFSVDPTTLVRSWINGRTLYIEHEAYGAGVDLDDTPALFDAVPDARKHTIRADNSRPETISHMRRHGYARILGCTKGPGSVEDGVEHLRSYERIVIHPRCVHAAEEARLWSYKTDKLTGDVLPVLLDKHDHIWDAVRYALEPIIRAGKPKKQQPKPPERRRGYEDKPEPPDWRGR